MRQFNTRLGSDRNMNFDNTHSDTIDPWSLLSGPANSEATDMGMNIPLTGFSFVDFGNISVDMDFGMMKPGLQEPRTADFSVMGLKFIHPNFANFDTVGIGEIAAGPGGYRLFDSGLVDSRKRGIDVMDHGTMLDQRANDAMMLPDTPENDPVAVDVIHHDLTSLSNPDPTIRGIGTMGTPPKHLANQASHLLTGRSRDDSCDVSLLHQHGLTTTPNPKQPAQTCLGDSATRKRVKSNNWREYRPKPRDARVRITAEDWQDYRPFLEQLYVVENVKLKEVMKILETKFGFMATYVIPVNSDCNVKINRDSVSTIGLTTAGRKCTKPRSLNGIS
jgi:hypothetical protein